MGAVKNFMLTLDEWTEETIIESLYMAFTHGPEEAVIEAKRHARKAIREKVLESYRNRQAAKPQKAQSWKQ
jgi:hypothetical protein